jgi:hypothetical protein
VRVGAYSFVLALPTWVVLLTSYDFSSGWWSAFALILLVPSALLGLLGLCVAAFPIERPQSERWLAGSLSVPALLAAALTLYWFARIPPS